MEIIKGKITWVDVARPTQKDLDWLRKKFHFHPVIIQELKDPSDHPLVEVYDHYLYLISQFPAYDEAEKISRRSELDILVTKNHVITVHYEKLTIIKEFKESLGDEAFKKKTLESTLAFTYELLTGLTDFNQRQLQHIEEKVELIAERLFKNQEREILREISYIKRDLSEYRIIIRSQEHFLKSFLDNGTKFWGLPSRVYLNDLVNGYMKLVQQLEDYHEAISDFEDTNNQMMNIKTTEVMKTFTTLSFMTFPFMLLAALFSMNTTDTPIVREEHGFWILLGVMIFGMLTLFSYFKRKNWL